MKTFLKTIYFPGGIGQRRQAQYQIFATSSGIAGLTVDTKIVFVADIADPARFDPPWESILSTDVDAEVIPNYLVNKVLTQELSGCRLDLIKVFFVSEPDESDFRHVYQWNLDADTDNPIDEDSLRSTFRLHASRWDWFKFVLGIPGAKYQVKGLTENPRAGNYKIKVRGDKPRLLGDARTEILKVVGLESKVVQ